jgi:transposase
VEPIALWYQARRGVALIVAVTFATEVGDVRRFDSPGQLMGYLGLAPSERSTGDTIRRGGITKAGNSRVRHNAGRECVELSSPAPGGCKEAISPRPKVREIAWKAQSRLTGRYRTLSANGKKTTVVCTAVARELAGFMWAVAREVQTA